MKILEILKRAFITRKCILCKDVIDYDSKEPFCENCKIEWLNNLDIMCSKCGFDCDYCTCLPEKVREINHSIAAFGVFYTPDASTPVNRIVYKLKRDYNLETIRFCAEIIYRKILKLCAKYGINYREFVITFPPRRDHSVFKYGYDHAKLLANELSKKIGVRVEEYFDNVGSKEQKTLTKNDRLSNAAESYALFDDADVKGKSIFIVDDVMTSGATLNVCSRMLLLEGAKCVIPVTFAKDMK